MEPIYLDNNATTLVDPRVKKALIEELEKGWGNPSSIHSLGHEAKNRLTKARRTIASYLGVGAGDLLFTSGGTESANMVLRGLFYPNYQGHLITTGVEHSSVFTTAKVLAERGVSVTFLDTGEYGAATLEGVRQAIRPDTKLIALMAANNETGTKIDIEGIAQLAYEAGVPFFLDGVAWLGKETLKVPRGVSALSFSGHKFHAPKGIGGLFLRQGFKLAPLFTGGEQEYSKRAGTENLLGIVGIAEAIRLLEEELPIATERMKRLRDKLEANILSTLSDTIINGQAPRIANTSNISFLGVDGESLLMNLDLAKVAASHGSACSSGALEPSRILLNMGIGKARAMSSIRFSLSRFTTEEEIDRASEILVKIVKALRGI